MLGLRQVDETAKVTHVTIFNDYQRHAEVGDAVRGLSTRRSATGNLLSLCHLMRSHLKNGQWQANDEGVTRRAAALTRRLNGHPYR